MNMINNDIQMYFIHNFATAKFAYSLIFRYPLQLPLAIFKSRHPAQSIERRDRFILLFIL